jgi:hypothetical protein
VLDTICDGPWPEYSKSLPTKNLSRDQAATAVKLCEDIIEARGWFDLNRNLVMA